LKQIKKIIEKMMKTLATCVMKEILARFIQSLLIFKYDSLDALK